MKKRNIMKRFLCLALCLCMTVGMLAMLASCGEEEETGSGEALQTEEAKEGEVAVIKALVDIEAGTKLTAENIGIGYALEEDIPLNAVRVTDKVLNKYATVKIYKGEFIFQGKLDAEAPGSDAPVEAPTGTSFVNVKESLTEGKDAATVIQKLIDDNPGKTLYFPDGTYEISKPITTSADPAKAVSFRLSNYAIIKASSSWSGDKAMIRIGGGSKAPDGTTNPTTSSYILGGIIDGNKKAKAISVEEGRDVLISTVSIKNAVCGITLAKGATGATNTDVENVNITGADSSSSVGMLIQGAGNTFTNLRISNVKTGVELTGASNTLRNIHVMYTGSASDAVGFYDNSEGNNYDMCFSNDFATGFRMGANAVSVYSGCGVFWDKITSQTAFKADGQFKSVVRSCRVDFTASGAYLKVASGGGAGQILYPIINGTTNNDYSSYLKTAQIKY